MAIKVGVGKSKEINSFTAGSLSAKNAITQLGSEKPPNLIFVFASSRFDQQQLIQGIRSIISNCPLVGCSTAGEISSEGPDKKSVVVKSCHR